MSRATVSGASSASLFPPMEYRRLGSTDLEVSVLGFGASPLGGVFGDAEPSDGERAVHLAIEHGINFFDVSPYYGLTLAEERLGHALAGLRSRVVLATKCGRYGADEFDFSAKRVRQSIEESLGRLRTDHVDLIQAHDVEFGDAQQIVEETIPAMRQLQQEGKARYVGITGYPLQVMMRIAAQAPVDSILSYCRYDLLIDDLDTALMPFAEKHGIGVINASPLHMGVLTERGAPAWHPAPQAVHEAGAKAAQLCRARGFDLSELALRWCLDYSRVASTLIGMSKASHVERNLRAFGTPADPELVRDVKAILEPVANLVWPSGRVENQDRAE